MYSSGVQHNSKYQTGISGLISEGLHILEIHPKVILIFELKCSNFYDQYINQKPYFRIENIHGKYTLRPL